MSGTRALLICAGLAACAGAREAARPPMAWDDTVEAGDEVVGPPVGVPGEVLRYQLAFRGLPIGLLQVAVGEPGLEDGRPVVVVRSLLESDGILALVRDLSWRLDSVIDLQRGLPLRSESTFAATVRGKPHKEHIEHTWGPSSTRHNLHSLIGELRAWALPEGEKRRLRVRIDGSFSVELMLAGHEYVRFAHRAALRFEGKADIGRGYRFTFWLSDDARRVPLRIQLATKWGEARVDLIAYDAPDGARPFHFTQI